MTLLGVRPHTYRMEKKISSKRHTLNAYANKHFLLNIFFWSLSLKSLPESYFSCTCLQSLLWLWFSNGTQTYTVVIFPPVLPPPTFCCSCLAPWIVSITLRCLDCRQDPVAIPHPAQTQLRLYYCYPWLAFCCGVISFLLFPDRYRHR